MAYIKISKSAFFHNLKIISQIAPKQKIAIVLKDNAYGHGLELMAKLVHEFGITKAIVRDINEAQSIENCFDFVLVLNGVASKKYSKKIHFTLNSIEEIDRFYPNTPIHIKVDTGMHRNGILSQDIKKTIYLLKQKNLQIAGVFSHNSSADVLTSRGFWQYKNFLEVIKTTKKVCNKLDIELPKFHFANSSTLFRMKNDAVFDMIRVGIGAYGYTQMDDVFDKPKLKPVLSLIANKISTRYLKEGNKVGYDGSGMIKKDGFYSTYDVGYADGFFRFDAKDGFEFDKNKKIIGKISMDNMTISGKSSDVALIKDATLWAKKFNTITYEVLAKLHPKILRKLTA